MEKNTKPTETVTISKAEYESMQQQIAWLMEQLKLSKKRQFGASSEKSEYDQMNIFNEAGADLSAPEPELAEIKAHQRKKSRGKADRLPPDLPVEIVEHELPEAERLCPDCDSAMHVMGRETRDELKLIPAKAVTLRHVYACRPCEQNAEQVPIRKAPMPNHVQLADPLRHGLA